MQFKKPPIGRYFSNPFISNVSDRKRTAEHAISTPINCRANDCCNGQSCIGENRMFIRQQAGAEKLTHPQSGFMLLEVLIGSLLLMLTLTAIATAQIQSVRYSHVAKQDVAVARASIEVLSMARKRHPVWRGAGITYSSETLEGRIIQSEFAVELDAVRSRLHSNGLETELSLGCESATLASCRICVKKHSASLWTDSKVGSVSSIGANGTAIVCSETTIM